ncbi:tRNA-2-methylthio-N(6)-dimethylallyladenosine synthase [Candidatus Kuenenia stuttgartiensis]|jgi:tRNA-2-methylthio-N6-dimethylallyladenosine synthase|uniref:tRNA-2-methylthio-N(6)-dimethylallyladenosine synthase n=1 Tax=Kuenenia stuttgartiensis TaxID=174633 RepID=Q1PZS6_KUEST|nr:MULTISPECIES: tRNA (N6-isopentenyl adenosine(37)-C2)-methylthiotransferase MiaB [Kuenenia]MBE7546635.1 tRNA (N6-isopentenyl adenosine(37)-C2)-methylthiotransferase MiaB [Planctomycetia bacterium]MBZ0191014.1 tRNA (N6-isopentenyl adenosine(37)-C2)-methylthiotransferase MiaB [Candidatus Kuenenia stuttgartiensis]MCL4726041.1 tRNA (N6-isopentenyl adenosine(37)-C2)-methylthiotransferase MiaB [Candidatus Kuenenia stuttgartiensis]MCZ7621720.1 tRNA (N6-isopentenyl adenosine(37)-C2)-methylthiotransfe
MINLVDYKNERQYKTVFFETFGCQMNKLDAELSLGLLQEDGYSIVDKVEEADVILYNTCSVRQHAEDKVYSHLGALRTLKKKHPDVIIGVLGCMAQKDAQSIFKRMPHVDLVCGTRMFTRLPELLLKIRNHGNHVLAVDEDEIVDVKRIAAYRPNVYQAFVTVMRGCDNYCSYCIVPYVRGREVSRTIADVEREVLELVSNGCREITLLGQNINSYGKSLPGNITLGDLLIELNGIEKLERLRFVTSHPKDMSRDLIRTMSQLDKACEYLHMPAQSGSDRILKKMHRGYTAGYYRELIQYARDLMPTIKVAGDFIVGFPGETEEDFQETVCLMEDIRFQNSFIFKYSTRTGTKAAELTDDVPDEIKKKRNTTLLDLQKKISLEENKKLIGRKLQVLVEGASKSDPNKLSGRTRQNNIVVFKGQPALVGTLVDITINEATDLTLFGTI